MTDYVKSIETLLTLLSEYVESANYDKLNSLIHKRIKFVDGCIDGLLRILYYERSLISESEFNRLNQMECDIYNTYLKYLNCGKR